MDFLLALAVCSGKILRIGLRDGRVETLTDDAGPTPDGIVVEAGTVYWTTMGRPRIRGRREADADYSRRDGGLHAMGLDGTERRDVLPAGSLTTGKQLTSDGSGTLYWGDREGCRVSRVRVDGSGRADLVIRQPVGVEDARLRQCVGVAVDPASGWIYWSQKGPAKAGKGRIFRAALDIPEGQKAIDRTDIELLWEGLPEPVDLDLVGDWLYWTDRGAGATGNTLNRGRVPRLGERGAAPQVLADGFAEAIGLFVDAFDGIAYVADLGGTIRRVRLPDGLSAWADQRVVASLGEPVTGIAGVRD